MKYFVERYGYGYGMREIRDASRIGVELNDGSYIALSIRGDGIHLESDDRLVIHCQSTNVMGVAPDVGERRRPSRVEGYDDTPEEALAAARRALRDLHVLTELVTEAKLVSRRREIAQEMRELHSVIQKATG